MLLGSAIQAYFTLFNETFTNFNILLDGRSSGQIRHAAGSLDAEHSFKVPLYSVANLEQTWHQLRIKVLPSNETRPSCVTFDYAEFT